MRRVLPGLVVLASLATAVPAGQAGRALQISQQGTGRLDVTGREVATVSGPSAFDLAAEGFGTGPATITLTWSSWDSRHVTLTPNVGKVVVGEGNVDQSAAATGLADPSGGDLRVKSGSGLIDNGQPGDLAAGESATDPLGAPRLVDGDSDGAARRDIGGAEAPAGTSPAHVTPPAQPPTGVTPPTQPAPLPQAQPADTPPTSRVLASPKAKRRRLIKGTAADNHGIDRVEVSITRRRGKRCRALTAAGRWKAAGKPRRGVCTPQFNLRAKGTTRWTLRLKRRLPRGTFQVSSRAFDDLGQIEVQPKSRRLTVPIPR